MAIARSVTRRIGRILKVLLFSVFALVLLLVGVAIMSVRLLTPEVLTPRVSAAASAALEAQVDVGRVELGLRASWPMFTLTIDSLTIRPNSITQLPADRRAELPAWADTLASFGQLRAALNFPALAAGKVDISDVEIVRPSLNILIVDEHLNNISIFPPSDGADTAAVVSLPDMRLRSFRLVEPRPIRFVNMADTLAVTIALSEASITREHQRGTYPQYVADFNSEIASPIFSALGLDRIPVMFNGDIAWNHLNPYSITLSRLAFGVSFISGELSTEINFDDRLLFNSFSIAIDPISISEALSMIPDSTARAWSLPRGLVTNGEVAFKAALTAPYDAADTGLPRATVSVSIPECMVRWQRVDLRRFALEASLQARDATLDSAVLNVERLLVAGPATTISLTGKATRLISDPLIDGKIAARVDLRRLPPVLASMIPGHMEGVVSANGEFAFSPSMFSMNRFYQIQASGQMTMRDMLYATADSATRVSIPSASVHFGTNERIHGERASMDSVLRSIVTVDSARIAHHQLKIRLRGLRVSVAAKNVASSSDTTTVTPVGGNLSVGSFSIYAHRDSAGMRLRGLNGSIGMVPLKDHPEVPRLLTRLSIDRLSAGDRFTRFMLTGSELRASAFRDPESPAVIARDRLRARARELRKEHPGISADSAMTLARRERRGSITRRNAHTVADSMELEVIDWHSTASLRRFLNEWKLDGELKAQVARLFTAAFPVRNMVRNFNVTFDTDSVLLRDVQYKAGRSDFLLSGRVTNMKRAFSSRRGRQPLKMRFEVLSDTIDVNELSHAFFAGAAASRRPLEGSFDSDNEDKLQSGLDHAMASDSATGPVLIPTNIDAELQMRANHVRYSDLLLRDMRGTVLAYDGAVNLSGLKASSAVGDIDLSALYSAPAVANMQFGFGMKLNRFDIANFLKLVPAIDSLMPLMRDFGGIVDANIAATAPVDRDMNINLARLRAAINLAGDSLTVIDPETFKTMAKWLLFKNKNRNIINHMSAELLVEDGQIMLFPFIFDFDRYRLGVQGSSDMAMNLNYHVAVLKSPLPFKFGINIKGTVDDMKIRLGRARFNEKQMVDRRDIVDTTRVNLLRELENVFRRGVRNSRFAPLRISSRPEAANINLNEDTLTRADSIALIKEGLIPANLSPQ